MDEPGIKAQYAVTNEPWPAQLPKQPVAKKPPKKGKNRARISKSKPKPEPVQRNKRKKGVQTRKKEVELQSKSTPSQRRIEEEAWDDESPTYSKLALGSFDHDKTGQQRAQNYQPQPGEEPAPNNSNHFLESERKTRKRAREPEPEPRPSASPSNDRTYEYPNRADRQVGKLMPPNPRPEWTVNDQEECKLPRPDKRARSI